MPPETDWLPMGHLKAAEGMEFDKVSVHKAFNTLCGEQDPKFIVTCFKRWETARGKVEGRAFCQSCAKRCQPSECTKPLLVREQSLIRYEVFQRGAHDPNTMAQRAVRGWNTEQRDASWKAPSSSSVGALVRIMDDAGHASPRLAEK